MDRSPGLFPSPWETPELLDLARGSDDFVWVLGSVSGAEGQSLAYDQSSLTLGSNDGILLKVDPAGEVSGLWATSTPAIQVEVDAN